MHLKNTLIGRRERRLPIVVVVRLTPMELAQAESHERTYTDNISAHGARVLSARRWQPGEHARITPVNQESALRGEVVYCQKRDQEQFFVGLKFPMNQTPWSAVEA